MDYDTQELKIKQERGEEEGVCLLAAAPKARIPHHPATTTTTTAASILPTTTMAAATTTTTAAAAAAGPGNRLLNYGNFAAYVLNIIVTYIVGTTNRIGKTNAEVSAEFPTLFTPAGWAFAIWGAIFLAEGVFSLWQLVPKNGSSKAVQQGVGIYWIAMVLVQVGWSFAFAKENIPLSMAFMLAIFLTLLALNLSLQRVFDRRPASALEYWCVQFPFSLNFGWITAATLANANITAVARDAGNLPAQVATAVCSCVVVGVAAVLGAWGLRDPVFVAVLVWATTAVSKQLQAPVDEISGKFPSFLTDGIAQAGMVLVGFCALCVLLAGVQGVKARNKAALQAGAAADDSPGRSAARALLKS